MTAQVAKAQRLFLVLLVSAVCSLPVYAGSAVVGSVAGSVNATISGQAILPNTTVLNGDSLQVREGMAVVSLGKGSRMIFGRETVASFLRESEEVTVLMSRGNVAVYHPAEGNAMLIKVGEAAITPAPGFATQGEIAMLGDSVVVTAREGTLRVQSNGRTTEVTKGKSLSVSTRTARSSAPTGPGGMGGLGGGLSTGLQVATVGGGAAATGLGAKGISDLGSTNTLLGQTNSNLTSSTSTLNNASSSSSNTGSSSNSTGCAVNTINGTLAPGSASPYTPPSGTTCP